MAVTDRLMNQLMAVLSGATEPVVANMLWQAINTACREGHIWRETVPITLVEGDASYSVAPDGTEVLHVFSVSHPTMDLNDNNAYYEFGFLTLERSPTAGEVADGPIYVVAALAPALDAPSITRDDLEGLIPVDMWSEHHDLLFKGTMGLMLAQPSKPYTNPNLAAYYTRDFNGKVAQAKHKVATGGVPGAQRWTFNRSFAPRPRR